MSDPKWELATTDDAFPAGGVINESMVPVAEVVRAMQRVMDEDQRSILAEANAWVSGNKPGFIAASAQETGGRRNGGIFYRDRYLSPTNPYDQMRLAAIATEQDDVVGNVADNHEALMFSSISMFEPDADQQDVMNQWAGDVELDARLREMGRQIYEVSQCYVALWWGRKTYKVRGRTANGNVRRKSISIYCPTRITVLDPLKIVPVGVTVFGEERLAWRATMLESKNFGDVLSDDRTSQDEIVKRLIQKDKRTKDGRYEPTDVERQELSKIGVDVNNLWLLDPKSVFRHTDTRPGFLRFAPIRMRRVFELLDLKQQLRQMERAFLIAGTNYLLVIKKGTDNMPAEQSEITNLQAQVRTLIRIPVLVGDHRLSVEIITPKLDMTLRAERFNTLDSRITATLYGVMQLGGYAAGAASDDSIKLTKVVARNMENRRGMLRRSLEKNIFRPMYEGNDSLDSVPKMLFHPKAIALDFDAAWASFLLQLAEMGDVSRFTRLAQFDLDEEFEATMREREADEGYDDIFKTRVPFSAPGGPGQADPQQPAVMPSKDNGGGNRNGGGAAPGSGQGKPPRNVTKRSDRGKKLPAPKATMLSLTDDDGNVVATVPLEAIRDLMSTEEGEDHVE